MYEGYLRDLLAPLGIYDLTERSVSGAAVCALGTGLDDISDRLEEIEREVRTAAYKIIEAKKATYYGIGMALTRITKAILGDEHSVLTVSAMLRGEYGQRDVFVGVPCIINQNGVQSILPLSLTDAELEKLAKSCDTLRESFEGIF